MIKKPIVMPKQTWIPTPADRFQDIRPCDGINQGANPLDIGLGQVTSILNMRPLHYPTIEVREGFAQVGSTHTGHYTTLLRKYGADIIKGDKFGVYKQNGSSWDNIINNGSAAERYWQAAEFDGVLVFVNGLEQPQKYSGGSVAAITDAPANARHIALHANRLFMVNDAEPNVIQWSKYADINVWTTFLGDVEDPSFQPINTNTGEDIEGIVTFQNRVVIFKKHSIHELYGERGYDFIINDISTHVGCAGWRTICEVNGVLYFLSGSGIFAYSGGSAPRMPISDPVKTYIESINWDQIDQCVGGTDGRRYFLTLVTGTDTAPSVTLMYDPEKAKNGQSSGWFVMDYKSTAFFDDREHWYTGTSDGKVFSMDDGDTDAGTAIPYEVTTKPIVRGNWHKKKRLNRMRAVVDIPAGATMNIYYSILTTGEDWTLIKTLAPTTDVKNSPVLLVGQLSEWFRLKVSGTGRVKIYALGYEVE